MCVVKLDSVWIFFCVLLPIYFFFSQTAALLEEVNPYFVVRNDRIGTRVILRGQLFVIVLE